MFDIILMFRKQLMLFFFYFLILTPALPADHVDESLHLPKAHTLPFKLGFEFQEISSLCPWAWPNNKIQKQALFEFIGPENKRLWHVELDTLDIEFVTVAFSFREHLALELALKTITSSINSLTELLNRNHGSITFGDWVDGLRRSLPSDNCKLAIIQEWVLPRTLLVSTTLPWKPTVAPQATIQHPLEWTIPLYFGLFGFESSQMLPFYASLPYRELLRKAAKGLNRTESGQILQSYTKKLNGLVFLHATTLVGMTPAGADDDEETESLAKALNNIKTIFQVDPKVALCLMSRRPFSSMLRDIRHFMDQPYQTYFEESIVKDNQAFTEFFEVPTLFHATNYGEQFFNPEGFITPLHDFPIGIEERFFEKNRQAIHGLLGEGVVTTTIIRHSINGLAWMKDYYQKAVGIENSSHLRYNITFDYQTRGFTIVAKEDEVHDSLSPPWLLEPNNSMGRFKKDEEIDKNYGEAIIEVRGIKNIGGWCLDKLKVDKSRSAGKFLTDPSSFTAQGMSLFRFLIDFNTEVASDVQLGILINAEQFKM